MKNFSYPFIKLSILLIILLLAAYLRFCNLQDNPAWYTDEATHVEIAKNILSGESRYFAIDDSYLLFARLPLFEYSLATVFHFFGIGMLSLRGFTASLGLITVVLLYILIWDISRNSWLSLLVAFAYAIMPQAILYSRFGFSYNLLLPLIMLSLWIAIRYQHDAKKHWLTLLSLCIGLGTITEFLMWSFLPLLLFIPKSWQNKFWTLALASIPLLLYCVWQLASIPEAFLFDLGYSLGRTGGGTILQQVGRLIENYTILISDAWWLLGIIGIFLLKDKALQRTCLLFFLPLIFVGRAVPLHSLSAYYSLAFLPIVAIGVGNFLYFGSRFALDKLRGTFKTWLVYGIATCLFLIPFAYIGMKNSEAVQTSFQTAIDAFLLNPQDVREVRGYIQSNSDANDMVVASAVMGAVLDRPSVDFQMSVVALGFDAVHIPHDLAPERFAYSADYRMARYVIVDNLWRNWGAVHIPAIQTILTELETWEMVFEAGELKVYENPQE